MLQALLEDRFKLKVHRETRQVSAYALSLNKGGPKLQRFSEGSCTPFDPAHPDTLPMRLLHCGVNFSLPFGGGPKSRAVEGRGASLDDLCELLRSVLERPVLNKTGIAGRFNFRLEYAPDQSTPGWRFAAAEPDDPSGGPSIFTAIKEQLGLKLESTKGPDDLLVIDHVERPSEN
jgi:uncharacterized protein (TIGR03435 family)